MSFLQPVRTTSIPRAFEKPVTSVAAFTRFSTMTDESAVEIRQLGGLQPLVKLLENRSPDIQKYAAMAIGNCSEDAQSRDQIRSLNGVQLLINLLTSDNADVQQKAAWALGRFCRDDDSIKAAMLMHGAIQALVTLLAYTRQQEVLETSMQVLATCASHAGCAAEIRRVGGLQALVPLLLSRTGFAQQIAALAIGCCASDAENGAEIRQLGGIRALVMQLTVSNRDIQQMALWALLRLTFVDVDNKKELQRLNAQQFVLRLFSIDNDVEVQERAVVLLAMFAKCSEADVKSVLDSGSIARLVNLIRSSSDVVAECAAEVLQKFSQTPALCVEICSCGGIEAAVAQIQGSQNAPIMKQCALLIGAAACSDAPCRMAIYDANAVQVLVETLNRVDTEVKLFACSALQNCLRDPEYAFVAVNAGLLEKLTTLLKIDAKSEDDYFIAGNAALVLATCFGDEHSAQLALDLNTHSELLKLISIDAPSTQGCCAASFIALFRHESCRLKAFPTMLGEIVRALQRVTADESAQSNAGSTCRHLITCLSQVLACEPAQSALSNVPGALQILERLAVEGDETIRGGVAIALGYAMEDEECCHQLIDLNALVPLTALLQSASLQCVQAALCALTACSEHVQAVAAMMESHVMVEATALLLGTTDDTVAYRCAVLLGNLYNQCGPESARTGDQKRAAAAQALLSWLSRSALSIRLRNALAWALSAVVSCAIGSRHALQHGVLRIAAAHLNESSQPTLLCHCLIALGHVMSHVPESVADLRRMGGVRQLVVLLGHRSVDVVTWATWVLTSCVRNEDVCLDVLKAGGTRQLLLMLGSSDPVVCLHAADCIAKCGLNDAVRDVLRQSHGVLQALLTACSMAENVSVKVAALWAFINCSVQEQSTWSEVMQGEGLLTHVMNLLTTPSYELQALQLLVAIVDFLDCAEAVCVMGGLARIASLLGSSDPAVVACSCVVLGTIVQAFPEARQIILASGILPHMMALLASTQNSVVLLSAVAVLSCINGDASSRAAVGHQGIQHVLQALSSSKDHETIKVCALVLAQAACDEINANLARVQGAVQVLLHLTRQYTPPVQCAVLQAVANLCSNEMCTIDALQHGVVEQMVELISAQDTWLPLQEAAAHVLGNVASHAGLAFNLLKRQDGLKILVMHVLACKSAAMIKFACVALANCCSDDVCRQELRNLGLMKALVAATAAPQATAEVLQQVCNAIANAALDSGGKAEARLQGALKRLLHLCKSTDSLVQAAAAAALLRCCSNSDTNRDDIIKLGAIAVLSAMLKSKHALVQAGACALLCQCGQYPSASAEMQASGAISLLITAMSSEDAGVSALATAALAQYYDIDALKPQLSESNAVAQAVAMLSSGDFAVKEAAALFLANISADDEEMRHQIHAHDGISTLCALLHSSDAAVTADTRKYAAFAIGNCCIIKGVTDVKATIVKRGTIAHLVSMLKDTQPEMYGAATFAIGNMCERDDGSKRAVQEASGIEPLVKLLTSASQTDLLKNTLFAIGNLAMNGVLDKSR
eukprot:TRINITY_DN3168_c0_g1_i3.p1 TRINITY_DN3168_c0_g1~~TRINITY_DN3168_c0_g1_i3.p1  ORF type:complete len:1527 (-),score=377.44 TRINITY_DN3168_c0_g1_i3:314-4894(-)